ncbi:SOS response-associated peptidase [Halomonas organivorans]
MAEEGLPPRYNIPQGTWITGFRQTAQDAPPPEPLDLWWGYRYRPAWVKGKEAQPFNARVEKVANSSYFKHAFARQHCLIPADGWFEWVATDTGKQPHYLYGLIALTPTFLKEEDFLP